MTDQTLTVTEICGTTSEIEWHASGSRWLPLTDKERERLRKLPGSMSIVARVADEPTVAIVLPASTVRAMCNEVDVDYGTVARACRRAMEAES